MEFFRLGKYRERDESLYYLQTKDGGEVDLIIKRPGKTTLFIEIKSKNHIREEDLASLQRLLKNQKNATSIITSQDPAVKQFGETLALPWQVLLARFRSDEI